MRCSWSSRLQVTIIHFVFTLCLTVWGVDPEVTHQTYDASCRLGSTGECGVPQNQAGERSA